jgi:hypothetical protein
MPRVTDGDVKTILDTTIDTTPFIQTATVLIDQYLVPAGLQEPLLTQIELWWSAHLACARDPRLLAARADSVDAKLQRSTGTGLDGTEYGAVVKALDPTGILNELENREAAIIQFL